MKTNIKYSFKDFTGQSLSGISASEFNHSEITGSCFSQESPDTEVFPSNITGVTFKRCNLDNVKIPAGATLADDAGISCSSKKIKVQNDLEDWVLDGNSKPVEPVNKKEFIALGLSVDPKDIPAVKRTGKESITDEKRRLSAKAVS